MYVNCVAFSPDGNTIASGSENATIRLWDRASAKEIAVLKGHESSVNSVAFSPDGNTIASASVDKTIRLWDRASAKEVAVLMGHEFSVQSVAFSPDGNTIASGSYDNKIRLWDRASAKEIAVLKGHEKSVNSVAFSPDGNTIASASNDNTIRLWDAVALRDRFPALQARRAQIATAKKNLAADLASAVMDSAALQNLKTKVLADPGLTGDARTATMIVLQETNLAIKIEFIISHPIPPPLSDEALNQMTREEAMDAFSLIAIARQRAEVNDETKARLKADFDKLKNYLTIKR